MANHIMDIRHIMEGGPLYSFQFDKPTLIHFHKEKCVNNSDRVYHFDCDTCTYAELIYLNIENEIEKFDFKGEPKTSRICLRND